MTNFTSEYIYNFVREQVKKRTGVADDELHNDTVLGEIGLRSIDAVLICGEIEDELKIEVEPAMMFEHKTLDAVTNRLMEMLSKQ